MALSARQKAFCEQYIVDLNGTRAAIRAGYSKDTARSIASENLTKPNIKSYVTKLQKELSERTMVTAEMVIAELKKVGFSNIQDFLEEENSITDISKIDPEMAASVKSIKKSVTEWGSGDDAGTKTVITFEIYDKLSALEKIGRHLGIFEADNKQKPILTIKVTESE